LLTITASEREGGNAFHSNEALNKEVVEMALKLDWSPMMNYTAEEIEKQVPAEPGVYRIFHQMYVDYVGQAENLKDKLKQHLLPSEPNIRLREHLQYYECTVRYAIVPDQADRNGAERYLYDRWKRYVVNDTVPPGPAVETNIA